MGGQLDSVVLRVGDVEGIGDQNRDNHVPISVRGDDGWCTGDMGGGEDEEVDIMEGSRPILEHISCNQSGS